ncbi:MAG: hypothetical protein COA90_09085 [Gammaproteobacteria bacterium]|nr:MAG: hypothetical protein COA90_09085 [Gammaproteobacteria bacterium]
MKPRKVIIATDKEYSDEYEYILDDLFKRKIDLFCAWGKYCGQWDTAMDLFITDPKRMDEEHHITTTCHNDEPFDDVLNMAELWFSEKRGNEVEIIKL